MKVWEAIALSLDIDPKQIKTNPPPGMAATGRFLHLEGEEFDDRLEAARRNLGEGKGLPLFTIAAGKPDYCQIAISTFALWALRVGWEMPDELKVLASKATPTPALSHTKPLSTPHEGKRSGPPAPDKLTLAWLWHHVPVSWWSWLCGVLIAAFVGGLTLGQSEAWNRLTRDTPVTQDKATPPPPASRSSSTNPPTHK